MPSFLFAKITRYIMKRRKLHPMRIALLALKNVGIGDRGRNTFHFFSHIFHLI